jgi:hypothetical protein
MRKLLLATLALLCIESSFAQTKINLQDVSKHIGDSVQVEGKVFGVKTFSDNSAAPVLLNLGADFPQQLLTIAVFPTYKTESQNMPTEKDKGALATVSGKIELYRGRPQIVVRSAGQLSMTQ